MSFSQVKVGCCGFPLKQLEYAARFPVVEVQQTFYQPPRLATLQRWRAAVPVDFEFTLKAWQLITHPATSPTYKRVTAKLTEQELGACGFFQETGIVQEAWLLTRACAEALGAKYVLFQCPGSFTPSETNLKNLRRFFGRLDRRGLQLVWEPRGGWPDALIRELCQELQLIHGVDPFVRPSMTRHLLYYRLHGGKDYRHRFEDRELRQLLGVLPQDCPAYILFNNVSMLEDALRFRQFLGAAGASLATAA